jgi:hypothetical protein
MALTDIHFQEGDGQDFILELPNIVYSGTISDVLIESSSVGYPVVELPALGGNIFIMSE